MAISSLTILFATLLALVTFTFCQTVYRLFLHPLKSFAGPWLNAATELPSALRLARGEQHRYYYGLHRKYGELLPFIRPRRYVSHEILV